MAKRKKVDRAEMIQSAGEKIGGLFGDAELAILSVFGGVLREVGNNPEKIHSSSVKWTIRSSINSTINGLEVEVQSAALEQLVEAYNKIAEELEALAEELNTDAANLQRQLDASSALRDIDAELNESFAVELSHMRRDVDDIYRQIIEAQSAAREETAASQRWAMQSALDEFAANGITGFTDKAGRRWGLQEYSDMATRTAMQRASMQATMDSMERFGWDLCFVNSHMGACPKCQKWQGVIMSLSGKTEGYHTVQEAMDEGLFHPNCAHILQVYFEGSSRLDLGTPAGWSDDQSTELYAARQKQRYIERNIRKWKRTQAAASTPEAEREAQAHVLMWQEKARENAPGQVQRMYNREGGRVKLSDAALKLKRIKLS